jgi:hypothetical protein
VHKTGTTTVWAGRWKTRISDRGISGRTRHWLAANFPPALAGVNGLVFQNNAHVAAANPDFQRWRVAMGDKGWGVPTWETRYGGAG